jgi:hypothetical protein
VKKLQHSRFELLKKSITARTSRIKKGLFVVFFPEFQSGFPQITSRPNRRKQNTHTKKIINLKRKKKAWVGIKEEILGVNKIILFLNKRAGIYFAWKGILFSFFSTAKFNLYIQRNTVPKCCWMGFQQ